MKRIRLAVLLTASLFATALAARADEKKTEVPVPPPEVKKLAFFFGTWRNEAEVKPNDFFPAGHYVWMDKCDWFPGGFHLVCYSAGQSPIGATQGLAIFGYNSEDKTYTYVGIDNSGLTAASKGVVNGNKWTYTSRDKVGGKTIHGRYTVMVSDTSYTFKYETSSDGKRWTLVMEGRAKRPEKKERPHERERERERERRKAQESGSNMWGRGLPPPAR